jgi:hypothetical protein
MNLYPGPLGEAGPAEGGPYKRTGAVMNGNGNGQSNGETRANQLGFSFADNLPIKMTPHGNTDELLREFRWMVGVLDKLILAVSGELRAQAALRLLVESIETKVDKLDTTFKEMMPALVRQEREFHEQDLERWVRQYALSIVEIIDRQTQELGQADHGVPSFDLVEDVRRIDREEHLTILRVLGFEQVSSIIGARFDSKVHAPREIRHTSQRSKIGRIAAVLRPGYVRRSDGFVLRPVVVSVFRQPHKS